MKLDISIRYIKPAEDAELITETRADGLSDGFHTGGAYKIGKTVFKALDGRPYGNADFHVETQELEVLALMQGEPFFPHNWNVQEINGRKWLVRPLSMILGRDFELNQLSNGRELVLGVEKAVRSLNSHGWEVNDSISLGVDPAGDFFIVDLSAVQYLPATEGPYKADDELRIHRFFDENKYTNLHLLRDHARTALHAYVYSGFGEGYTKESYEERRKNRNVYASFNRPLSRMWATLPEGDLVQTTHASWQEAYPHTWFFATQELSSEIIYKYELTWGWSPIIYTNGKEGAY